MNRPVRILAVVIALGACVTFAASEPGDPARWYQPAGTPQQKHQNAMIEARQALAVALAECRKYGEQKTCQEEARAQYQKDVEYAKSFLASPRVS